jgi:hypothetical protein
MTLEEKRIKIAEHLGWKGPFGWGNAPTYQGGEEQGLVGIDPDGDVQILPNFFRDLNDCHEMLRTMPYEKEASYMHILTYKIMMKDEGVSEFDKHMATPCQRSAAFGLTFGLWKDGE